MFRLRRVASLSLVASVGRSCDRALHSMMRLSSTVEPAAAASPYKPSKTNKKVSRWLFASCALVGGIVVVGGITRLTESGLSIVDWRPVTGLIPPLTDAEWNAEFAKYQQSPEFKQKSDMTVHQFKEIFFWEWFHRVLARSVGVVYGAPLLYYASRGCFKGRRWLLGALVGILGLGGCQGALGWYMVKSGLDPKLLDEKRKATVSAARLAAHLSLAFVIYASMLRIGLGLRYPVMEKFKGKVTVQFLSRWCFVVMFCTAISGAFVAGLDAGLLYNDGFPLMGGRLVPPAEDLLPLTPQWRNLFEHGPCAQLWHRLMAGTTTLSIVLLNVAARKHHGTLPSKARKALRGVNHALAMQVLLGIASLMSYVYTPVAAAHQAGSLLLLSTLIKLCAVLGSKGLVL
jgi:cytochrome c oxidase assembly protein subunit 15